ncbi:Alpha/Beta hydrolase protein, partial [Mycena floridula]
MQTITLPSGVRLAGLFEAPEASIRRQHKNQPKPRSVTSTQPISLTQPTASTQSQTQAFSNSSSAHLAILVHPWSHLGGSMYDPVLDILSEVLLSKSYHVIRYNTRGSGGSSGWASLSGVEETKDLEGVVRWGVERMRERAQSVESESGEDSEQVSKLDIRIIGYSYGAIIAANAIHNFGELEGIWSSSTGTDSTIHHPRPATIQGHTLLLSYPLSPRSFLTLFGGKRCDEGVTRLMGEQSETEPNEQHERCKNLLIHGTHDEFTSVGKIETWIGDLKERISTSRGSSSSPSSSNSNLDVRVIPNGSHFWRGEDGREMCRIVREWLEL